MGGHIAPLARPSQAVSRFSSDRPALHPNVSLLRALATTKRALKSKHRHVLFGLACFLNFGGEAWPSITTLAHTAGMRRDDVVACTRELVEMGVLAVTPNGGPCKANLYRVRIAALSEPIDTIAEPSQDSPNIGSLTVPTVRREDPEKIVDLQTTTPGDGGWLDDETPDGPLSLRCPPVYPEDPCTGHQPHDLPSTGSAASGGTSGSCISNLTVGSTPVSATAAAPSATRMRTDQPCEDSSTRPSVAPSEVTSAASTAARTHAGAQTRTATSRPSPSVPDAGSRSPSSGPRRKTRSERHADTHLPDEIIDQRLAEFDVAWSKANGGRKRSRGPRDRKNIAPIARLAVANAKDGLTADDVFAHWLKSFKNRLANEDLRDPVFAFMHSIGGMPMPLVKTTPAPKPVEPTEPPAPPVVERKRFEPVELPPEVARLISKPFGAAKETRPAEPTEQEYMDAARFMLELHRDGIDLRSAAATMRKRFDVDRLMRMADELSRSSAPLQCANQ